MEPNKKAWPLASIFGIKDRINTNPDFQRPAVWGKSQKQLLIDTILRNYDIPKLYWRKTSVKPEKDKYDVVDGQQRLRAIWEFFDGGFGLPKDADSIDGNSVAGLKYEELPDELRIHFDTYPLDIVILSDTDEDEVREMFLRLQNGTTLKAQEKRNAYPGKMRDFVRELTKHTFFTRVGFANSRFSHDLVAAQLVRLEITGAPTNIKNTDLNKMYQEKKEFSAKDPEAKAVQKTLDFLSAVFPEKTPELERFNVITLYCVISELQKQYVVSEVSEKIYQWFIDFEQTRIKEDQKPDEDADPEWRTYREKISHSTDTVDSIQWRTEFLLKDLLNTFPSLSRRDNIRGFTHTQKLTIFRRDLGLCKVKIKCDGEKLKWDEWHCDHRIPWSKGGKTTVENGQASCVRCNLSKSDNI